jgi:dihydrofolate synthase / folylpolyglutamate synthase
MMRSSLQEWIDYIFQLHANRVDLGLERIREVATTLQLLQWQCPVITIAGTNGKGSCAAILESCYVAAGLKVGCYTSPELLRFNERIQLNQKPVSDDVLLNAFEQIERVRGGITLSFFEYTTLAALLIFQQSRLDVMILEVGLGGRLDAVNIIDPTVALITSIGIDHVAWLGSDRESIAREKAGIMRAGVPVICGDSDMPQAIRQHADEIGAPLFVIHQDFLVEQQAQDWTWSCNRQSYHHLPKISLRLDNAASAMMVIEYLQQQLAVSSQSIHDGLQRLSLQGRFELVTVGEKTVIFDVAHNVDSVTVLAKQLDIVQPQGSVRAVFSALAEKDLASMVAPLVDRVCCWYVASLNCERAASVDALLAVLQQYNCCYQLCDDVVAAFDQAMVQCDTTAGESVLVYGSFKTVAAAKLSAVCSV